MSAAACASLPQASTPMAFGFAASPPRGFVDFCERQPGDCNATGPELAEMRIAANTATSSTAVSAITYDWSRAFAERRSAPADSGGQASLIPAASTRFDWSGVFVRVKAPAGSSQDPASRMGAIHRTAPAAAPTATMNRETWSLLTRVNDSVNRAITPRDDLSTYGVADYWATPLESGVRYGDCEDYVLEKRHELMAAGLPQSALSIAVVLTDRGETHAVLVVATSTGDYVLDNRTPWILPWAQTAYRWRERQVAGSASQWAFAAGPVTPQDPTRASFLIASTR
ncbi:MAG: hypothetical protein E7812_12940 [Phenylobacterium sp.]|nr:MAG: hypothetical protein E7812_12940 [Phenylobacterium sp.]